MAKVGVLWQPEPAEREMLLEAFGEVAWLADAPDPDVQAVLTFFPRREMAKATTAWSDLPNVGLIQSCTAGLNHVGWDDLPDVPVAAAPGATGPIIAEYVLGCILAWSRGLVWHTDRIKKGDFRLGDATKALAELRVGVVGLGGIGQAVGRLLHGLGCTLEGVSRSGDAGDAAGAFAWTGTMGALPAMAARCDVLVLCLPLTRETEGLVDLDLLSGMSGRHALLVNVARGPIVREPDLFAWLDSSRMHMAALDVWWRYPGPSERPFSYPFETLPNVIMTPHNSPNVAGFRLRMLAQAIEQVQHFLATGEALHVHDPAWYGAGGDGR